MRHAPSVATAHPGDQRSQAWLEGGFLPGCVWWLPGPAPGTHHTSGPQSMLFLQEPYALSSTLCSGGRYYPAVCRVHTRVCTLQCLVERIHASFFVYDLYSTSLSSACGH